MSLCLLPTEPDVKLSVTFTSAAPCPLVCCHAFGHADNRLTSETVRKTPLNAFLYINCYGHVSLSCSGSQKRGTSLIHCLCLIPVFLGSPSLTQALGFCFPSYNSSSLFKAATLDMSSVGLMVVWRSSLGFLVLSPVFFSTLSPTHSSLVALFNPLAMFSLDHPKCSDSSLPHVYNKPSPQPNPEEVISSFFIHSQ